MYDSDAGRWKTLGVPLVKGGQNLTPMVGLGLTNLLNKFRHLGLKKILADQLTLYQPGGADYAHHMILAPPDFQTFLRPW